MSPAGPVLHVVDAFTDRPFTGNPAAVTILERYPSDEWMQAVAREMNLSETAYLVARADGDFDLRWFTPTAEVDLCGHATLASAHVVGPAASFHTRSGVLTCRGSGSGLIEMDFPADPPRPVAVPDGLSLLGVRWAGEGRSDLLLELADARSVREFRPDLAAIAATSYRALIVTAAGDEEGVDCVSRVFAPAVGIPEDPVTGSAHCTLAGFWSGRTGRTELTGRQVSRRGGTVYMRLETGSDRVVLGGRAVTVSEVKLLHYPE
jgi:predicted PhzF superfamily epimerase YddE/YHI9